MGRGPGGCSPERLYETASCTRQPGAPLRWTPGRRELARLMAPSSCASSMLIKSLNAVRLQLSRGRWYCLLTSQGVPSQISCWKHITEPQLFQRWASSAHLHYLEGGWEEGVRGRRGAALAVSYVMRCLHSKERWIASQAPASDMQLRLCTCSSPHV